ncbi:MAG: MFS transporter [Dehalococcoidia bacterium]
MRLPDADCRLPLKWLGYGGMLLIGIYISALGPGLPSIAARAHVPLAQAGTLFTALFTGGLLVSIGSGHALDRIGRRPILVAGTLVHGLGCLALSFATNWPEALAGGVLLGIGDGTLVVAYHVVFADLARDGAGAALNRLNAFFGIGALLGPGVAALSLLAAGDIRYALWLVAAAQGCAALLLMIVPVPALPHVTGEGEAGRMRDLLRRPLVQLLALLLFLYVGLEVGLGNWTYTYLHERGGFGVATASLLTSGYWLSLTLGRALSPFALRRLSDPHFLLLSTLVAAGSAVALVLLAGWRPAGALCILLVGFGFGPIWPMAFAAGAGAFRQGSGTVSGLLATAGSIGGLLGPWLQGLLLLQHGARWGMAYTLAGCAGMTILAAAALRHQREARTEVVATGVER